MAALKINIKAAPKTEKKEYPELDDPTGEMAMAVDELVTLNKKVESLSAQMSAIEQNLKETAIRQFFEQYHGHTDIPSSMKVRGFAEKIMLSFTSRYKEIAVDDKETVTQIKAVLNGNAKRVLQERFAIKIDGDKVPEHIAQDLCDELVQLFDKYVCTDALSLKQTYGVTKGFHTERHKLLSPTENNRLNEYIPFVTSVKKKGVV